MTNSDISIKKDESRLAVNIPLKKYSMIAVLNACREFTSSHYVLADGNQQFLIVTIISKSGTFDTKIGEQFKKFLVAYQKQEESLTA